MPPEYRIAYRSEQRDPRTPIEYKIFFSSLCLLIVMLTIIVCAGAIYQPSHCDISSNPSYQNGNRIFAYVVLGISGLAAFMGIYTLVRWPWMWLKDVAFPALKHRYGEDIEDVEPGFLTISSAKSFLSTQAATNHTKREVELAESDLEKAQWQDKRPIADLRLESSTT
jgi:hypothetical protein